MSTTTISAPTVSKSHNADRLGVEPVGKLLLHYSMPAIIGMTASSLYNIIDRAFIGNGVGPLAISGLALTLPIMNLTAAFGAMIGAGASTMVSIRLGQQKKTDATHILGNTLLLNFIIGLTITVLGLIFLEPILFAFGASEATMPYARDFMQIILLANLFNHNFLGLNNVMRASGYPKKAMWSSLITVVVNLGLAPLFIFVFGWGIRGAALATAIAQIVGFLWVMLHFLNKNSFLHFQRGFFHLSKRIVGDILSIGLSPFLMNITASLITVVINKSLASYGGPMGDLSIGAYGIVGSVAMLFIMVVFGLNMGMQPIAGYNYGAKKMDRVLSVYKRTLITGTAITTFGFLLAILFPRFIVGIFTDDATLSGIATQALRIVLFAFPVVGFQVVTTYFFQSIGKAKMSIFLSLSRQLIFLLPGLLLFPHFWGVNGVWVAMPVGDIIASLLTLFVIMWQRKKIEAGPTLA
ncbi:MAG: MATE family efflux transporter [Bacteroidales bacterium]|nr:MATE family efflux transporter [Bacteroidales bacterium]